MGKVILVTGASSDVGVALIKRIHKNYDKVLAHYNSSAKVLDGLKSELGDKLVLLQSDFCDASSVTAMVDRIRELDCVPDHIVHLPALEYCFQKFQKENWDRFAKGMELSLHSIVTILQAFMPNMMKKKHGRVVFMLTSCVLGNPPKYQSAYVTTKYALLGLMKSLAVEYAGKGITVNGVSPDMIQTRFLDGIPEIIINKNAESSPLGRLLTVDDVVPAFEYLLSEGADTVTGQNIGVTGGA